MKTSQTGRQRTRAFFTDQAKKTIRQPSRIFIVPYNIARSWRSLRPVFFLIEQIAKTVRQPARIIALWAHMGIVARSTLAGVLLRNNAVSRYLFLVGKRWLPTQTLSLAARRYFEIGHRHLDANEPEAAWRAFRSCLKFSADPIHYFVAAICLMVGLGRFQEAMALFTRANELLRGRAKSFGIEDAKLRYLEPLWAGGFGHLAQMDYFIKLEIMEGRKYGDTILHVPRGFAVPNKFLLDQWRPFLKIIEDEKDFPLPADAFKSLSFNFLAPRLPDGSTVHLWQIGADTYRRWEGERRKPLLRLSPEIERRGWQVLQRTGIPRDAWFVALHVREAASKQYHAQLHDVLNADIETYLPAIEEIVRRGGWVIRIGDPAMKALPPLPNVFDYCHSAHRADWMDIFLCASCRFFVGTSSGPAYVPTDFGKPCVHTNWWPPAQRPWHGRDIFLPKLYRKIRSSEYLTLSQSLREPFGYCNSMTYLKAARGVEVVDNSSDDICAAIVEMLDRVENKIKYESDDLKRRERAEYIYRSNDVHGAAVLARSFMQKHEFLLD